MPTKKEFYDRSKVLAAYLAGRKRPDNPNDALERPLFMELVGHLQGLDIIDLGSGDGAFGREALSNGARSYHGVDSSHEMARMAQEALSDLGGSIHHGGIEDWRCEPEQADLVAARLSLNYLENLMPVFQEVFSALRPKGRFIVSLEHPIISSNYAHIEQGKRTSWLVDNYFQSGARVHNWLGEEISKYHHTLEEWLGFFTNAGFRLEHIRESRPQRVNFHSMEEYERRLRIPLFLCVAAHKPA